MHNSSAVFCRQKRPFPLSKLKPLEQFIYDRPAPLSSSTVSSCPFTLLSNSHNAPRTAAMPLEVTVETPAPCKTNQPSHSLGFITTRTLQSTKSKLPSATEHLRSLSYTFGAHSVFLTALQRGLGHTIEQCIASKAQLLCHAFTRVR